MALPRSTNRASYSYFGADANVIEGDCVIRGCMVTLVEGVDKEDGYIWGPLPELYQSFHGGYKIGEQITLSTGYTSLYSSAYGSQYTKKCWVISLTEPSQCYEWSSGGHSDKSLLTSKTSGVSRRCKYERFVWILFL